MKIILLASALFLVSSLKSMEGPLGDTSVLLASLLQAEKGQALYIKGKQEIAIPSFEARRTREEKRLSRLTSQRKRDATLLADITNFRILIKLSQEAGKPDSSLLDLKDHELDSLSPSIPQPLCLPMLGNGITACDLSHNNLQTLPLYLLLKEWPNLNNLIARSNKIAYIEARDPRNSNSFLANNTRLTHIDMSNNNIDTIEPIKELLAYCHGLQCLNLIRNALTDSQHGFIDAYVQGFVKPVTTTIATPENEYVYTTRDRVLEIQFGALTE